MSNENILEQIRDLIDENTRYMERKKMSKNELTAQYNAVVAQNQSLQQEIMHYRKILGEIKELATKSDIPPCFWVHDCSECTDCHDEYTNRGERCMQYGLYKILKKCEVLQNGKTSS